MNPNLLAKLFGADGRWSGPCRVILDANADVQSISNDSFVQGGLKNFAPRLITGRVAADAVRLLPDQQALLLVQTTVIRQGTGEDIVKRSMLVVDTGHVAAIEFPDLGSLSALGIDPPK